MCICLCLCVQKRSSALSGRIFAEWMGDWCSLSHKWFAGKLLMWNRCDSLMKIESDGNQTIRENSFTHTGKRRSSTFAHWHYVFVGKSVRFESEMNVWGMARNFQRYYINGFTTAGAQVLLISCSHEWIETSDTLTYTHTHAIPSTHVYVHIDRQTFNQAVLVEIYRAYGVDTTFQSPTPSNDWVIRTDKCIWFSAAHSQMCCMCEYLLFI